MALNFPIPTTVGQVYQDPTSGNTYVCTSLGPPAQWVGSGSSTSLDGTYLRRDASNDPVTGELVLEPTTNVNSLLVKQPVGNTTPAIRVENSGTGNSIEVDSVFSVSSGGDVAVNGNITFTDTSPSKTTSSLGKDIISSSSVDDARTNLEVGTFIEVVDHWNDGSQVTNWDRFSTALQTVIDKNRSRGFSNGAMVSPPGSFPGGGAYHDGVLLPDGKVYISPHLATTARIYDPVNNVLITPAGTYPGNYAYLGAVLLQDGRVFLAPYANTVGRIYDPINDTVTITSGTYPGGIASFVGAVVLQDGRVFSVPHNSTTARIYDPVTDTVTTPSGTYPGGGAFSGGTLLPDGRVFCVPHSSTTARIYDPVTDTLTTPSGTYPGGGAFFGGTLLPDGRVFCTPYSSTTARIYDPATDTLITPSGTYSSVFPNQATSVLLPDGRVFCVPFSGVPKVYDPVTDTLITPPGDPPPTLGYLGGILLPDGRVYCPPHSATTARIAAFRTSVPLDMNIPLSPFYNKS